MKRIVVDFLPFCEEYHSKPNADSTVRIKGLKHPDWRYLNGTFAVVCKPINDEEKQIMRLNASRGFYEIQTFLAVVPQEVMSVVVRNVVTRDLPRVKRVPAAKRIRVSTATRNYMDAQEERAKLKQDELNILC